MQNRLLQTLLPVATFLFATAAYAQGWVDMATINGAVGVNANRLCVGYGRTDLGCPTTAPYVTSGGLVGIGTTSPAYPLDVSGTVRATAVTADTLVATNANALRMVYGSYGALWRNDGSNLYLLLTNSGDQYGNWNSLRPFAVNLATGTVSLAATSISGNLSVSGVLSGNGSGLTNVPGDNLGNHTATQDLTMGSNQVIFGNTATDKVHYYSNTYGRGIESSTLTDWSGSQFRWRTGGTSVSTGTERMLLTTAGLTVAGTLTTAGEITAGGALNMGANAITSAGGTIRDASGGWVRTYGNTGWYNGTYGGGWYMIDTNYVRNFNNKGIYATTTSLPGVTGDADSSYGVYGLSGSNYGVYGYSASTYGVRGQTGTAGAGAIIGYTQNGAIYGILAHANAYSLYGNGQIYVSGNIATPATISGGYFSGNGGGLSGVPETDPQVAAVTSGKWCRGTGSQVTCDQTAPSGASCGSYRDLQVWRVACPTGTNGSGILHQCANGSNNTILNDCVSNGSGGP